jgi:hypothetical protein
MASALGNSRRLRSNRPGVKGGKWFSLADKVHRPTTLEAAWRKVERNKGSSGIDGQGVERFAAGAQLYLAELHESLKSGGYRPAPVKRVDIPKGDGRTRPLGIPTVKDRIVQTALKMAIEPIFETQFREGGYGFQGDCAAIVRRPGRGCKDALRQVDRLLKEGCAHVADADLKSYLDTASYCPLVHEVRSKSSGCRAIALIRSPFCLPRMTWTASSSPRLTRCNTVWRETPSALIASRMGMKPSPASPLNLAVTSSVKRMRQGAPGVSCSPGMMPALSVRLETS